MRELAAAGARDACGLDRDGTERRRPVTQLRAGQRFVWVRPRRADRRRRGVESASPRWTGA